MDVTPLIKSGSNIIQGYAPGSLRISGELYTQPVIVFPDHIDLWDFSGDPAALTPEDFQDFLDDTRGAEVALIGCGGSMQMLPVAVKQAFSAKGVVAEPMDTGAACRTYNVLLSEDRRVAGLLIPVK